MKRFNSLSLQIGIAHILLVGLSLGLFLSPLGTRPGPMHPVLILPFFYCLLSFIPALMGIVVGLVEVFSKPSKKQPILGLCLNTVYLAVYFGGLALMWDRLMGI